MVRNKKMSVPRTQLTNSPRRNTGPMDDFIATPVELRGSLPVDKMAPPNPGLESMGDSLPGGDHTGALTQIRAELTQISQRMLSKADKDTLVQELRAAFREEVAGLRTDLNTLEQRVEEVETAVLGCEQQHRASEIAVTRQGNMLITLCRQVEDLENRSRRNNICIHSLPEGDFDSLQVTLAE
ncbi:Hypothetical predicted protein [Pelobates cultripes]|uniref:Uncharacterized protein n=1 Tax=Pelobates cultripes TaxID=61616 RepID=A0AAD1VXH8_PELCU|nr:Hypothetical predicted protein [Pelobates cultripes]